MDNKWKDFWIGRWNRGETGWHQSRYEPAMMDYFHGRAEGRVLVPLCGKTLDMVWLASQGHEVIGVELSELACRAFFEENGFPFETRRQEGFTVFRSSAPQRISIVQGDFFALSREIVETIAGGPIAAIYDRAALIALPASLRAPYARKLIELTPEAKAHLQIVLERSPHDQEGPPFSVPAAEVRALYSDHGELRDISKGRVEAKAPAGATTFECVYELKKKTPAQASESPSGS